MTMANVKKGTLTPAPQWWKHLKECKRTFWHAERAAHKEVIKEELESMCWHCGREIDSAKGEHYCSFKRGGSEE